MQAFLESLATVGLSPDCLMMEDAALAERGGHQHRLVPAGAVLGGVGESGREHRQILRRAAQPIIEFVLRVHPLRRQASHDGVLRLAGLDHEGRPVQPLRGVWTLRP